MKNTFERHSMVVGYDIVDDISNKMQQKQEKLSHNPNVCKKKIIYLSHYIMNAKINFL